MIGWWTFWPDAESRNAKGLGVVETGELGRISNQVDRNRESVTELRVEVAIIIERLARSEKNWITPETLKRMEVEIMAAVDVKIAHICEHLTAANTAQSKDLTTAWQNQREADYQTRMAAQLADRDAIIAAVRGRGSRIIWWVLGIVGAVITSVASTLIVVALLGRP